MTYAQWFDEHQESIMEGYKKYLTFPSVSTQEKHSKDVLACYAWLEQQVQAMGVTTEKWEGKGYPVLFGELQRDVKAPTVLLYGHYDVQPVDPLELWDSPPFAPQIRDGVMYARGAQDNKGQNWYTLCAVKAFLEKHPNAPLNIKLFIEGEEESGSETAFALLEEKSAHLQADHLLIVDMNIGSFARPQVCIGARGIMTMEVGCRVLDRDVHSGMYGGIAYNPNRLLAEVLSRAIDANGHITIPGFYDSVQGLSASQQEHLDGHFDKDLCQRDSGIKFFHHEEGYTLDETRCLRPTFEINGMWGGYTEKGFKTVIPREARAKISCRLVPDQKPANIYEKVQTWLRSQMPKGVELDCHFYGGGDPAWSEVDSKTVHVVRQAYKDVFGQAHLVYDAGSIPITSELAKYANASYALPGTGLGKDNIHSPNENFSLEQFRYGFLLLTKMLELFAENSASCYSDEDVAEK